MINTPILYIVFNRPDIVSKSFAKIKEVKPKQLFIAADGPRDGNTNDKVNCENVKEIISDRLDWDCDVKYLYRDKNLGCGKAVSGAITWFFNNVEEGIILEDDCLPDLSFFNYCQELLSRYRDDKRIYTITGSNGQKGNKRGDADYYFSRYPGIWGWATWKDRWGKFRLDLSAIDSSYTQKFLEKLFNSKAEIEYHMSCFMQIKTNKVDTWDYQWKYVVFKNEGMCATPNVNLISNIGFGEEATHTINTNNWRANLAVNRITSPIKHPARVKINSKADKYISKLIFQNNVKKASASKLIKDGLKYLKSFFK